MALGALAVTLIAGSTLADQQAMRTAIEQLRQARHQLEQAPASRSGHRARAIDYIDDAIRQVQEGLNSSEDAR
jgi:hypothetical protein